MTVSSRPMQVLVVWLGLPAYAATCLRNALDSDLGANIDIVGVLPSPAVAAVCESLGTVVRWVDNEAAYNEATAGKIYSLAIVSGWRDPICRLAARKVRAAGGHVVAMIDNRWEGSLRQWLRAGHQRVFARYRFFGAWVPGSGARRMAASVGIPANRVYTRLYGADPRVFRPGTDLFARPKKFLFVGQLIARKRVTELASAFCRFAQDNEDWQLEILGDGPAGAELPTHSRIRVRPFSDPAVVASAMRGSRFLILPSTVEHWGVVVHEACLSGCGLILSNSIGAAEDLVGDRNCIRCGQGSVRELEAAFAAAARWPPESLQAAQAESVRMASRFGPQPFARELARIIEAVRASSIRLE